MSSLDIETLVVLCAFGLICLIVLAPSLAWTPSAAPLGRYQRAYRRADRIVGTGRIFTYGCTLLGAVVFSGVVTISDTLKGQLPPGAPSPAVVAMMIAGLIWFPAYVAGMLISVLGRILTSSVDQAVGSSPFLSESQKASLLLVELPRSDDQKQEAGGGSSSARAHW